MEYLNALIGNTEMYIPVNEKLGSSMLLAHKRLNYKKHIARIATHTKALSNRRG